MHGGNFRGTGIANSSVGVLKDFPDACVHKAGSFWTYAEKFDSITNSGGVKLF